MTTTTSAYAFAPVLPKPTHHRVAGHINAAASDFARRTLDLTEGRETYDWEGNGIRISYAGTAPDGTHGDTERLYWNDANEQWTTKSPWPSQSGTGLMNLQLDHVAGADDAVIVAKRELAFMLIDPQLDIVDYVITNNTTWQDLTTKYARYLDALRIRLAEIIEQKVLENPQAGLSLRDLAAGTPIVGWMARTLDGAVFNTMRRIVHNAVETSPWEAEHHVDEPRGGRTVTDISAHLLPASAEERYLADIATAEHTDMEDGYREHADSIRRQELLAYSATTLLTSQNLPLLVLPDMPTRKAMIAQLEEQPSLAYDSLIAWHNLISTNPIATDRDVPDEWLEIWQNYEGTRDRFGGDGGADDVGRLLALAAGGRRDRVTLIVQGLIGLPDPLSRSRLSALAGTIRGPRNDTKLRRLISRATAAWDAARTGTADEGTSGWEEAAAAVVASPLTPYRSVGALDAHLTDALHRI